MVLALSTFVILPGLNHLTAPPVEAINTDDINVQLEKAGFLEEGFSIGFTSRFNFAAGDTLTVFLPAGSNLAGLSTDPADYTLGDGGALGDDPEPTLVTIDLAANSVTFTADTGMDNSTPIRANSADPDPP